MKREEILNFLPSTYCRIKESNIHGVGVHAVVDIEKGVNLFPDCVCDLSKIVKIKKEEVLHLDQSVKKMMSDFFIETKTHYFTTVSLNRIDISYFLNHSDTPNCFWNEKDDSFYTLENIKIGEELTLDYNKYIVSDLVKNV
jgi:SET domain-containing protein